MKPRISLFKYLKAFECLVHIGMTFTLERVSKGVIYVFMLLLHQFDIHH